MANSERLAVAAHLHVLLRRKTGRVTDTEWMASNAEYAAAIVGFARQRAVEDAAPELQEWADKLELAMREADGAALAPRPLAESAAQLLRSKPPEPEVRPRAPAAAPDAPRYVGGIR